MSEFMRLMRAKQNTQYNRDVRWKQNDFRSYSNSDTYKDLVVDRYLLDTTHAYHISVIYNYFPDHNTANTNFNELTAFLFINLISGNWKRHSLNSELDLICFLDVPGSKHSNYVNPLPHAVTPDSYHHHAILLFRSESSPRIEKLIPEDANQIDLIDVPVLRSKLNRRYPFVRSCFIQRLPSLADVTQAASYASKAAQQLSARCPDEAVQIFPRPNYNINNNKKEPQYAIHANI